MLGRSDGTLNPNGVRFGSAEIYNIVEHFSEIADSLCVSINSLSLFQSTDVIKWEKKNQMVKLLLSNAVRMHYYLLEN